MGDLGQDIASVLVELGKLVTIIRSPTNLTERILFDVNGQASNPFMREHYLSASLSFETVIVEGDLIQFHSRSYLVIHKTPEDFEGDISEYDAGLLKCNIPSFSLLSLNSTQDPDTLKITNSWTVKKSSCIGLIYKDARRALLNIETALGKDTEYTLDCFVPASYNSAKDDRIYINSTTYYRVQDVEPYAYPGVHVLTLVEDERLAYVP